MAGLPPLLGFVAKESVYEAFIHREEASGWVGGLLLAGIVVGSILTFAYSARFIWGGFAAKPGLAAIEFKPVPWTFLAAPAILAAATLLFGLWPVPVENAVEPYAGLFPLDTVVTHLALWHGLTPALGLTRSRLPPASPCSCCAPRLPPSKRRSTSFRRPTGSTAALSACWTRWPSGHRPHPARFAGLLSVRDPAVAIVTPLSAVVLMEAPLPHGLGLDTPAQAIAGLIVAAGALGRHPGKQAFHGGADGLGDRLRTGLYLRHPGCSGPGADPDAGGNHLPGGDRAGAAFACRRGCGCALRGRFRVLRAVIGAGLRPDHDRDRDDGDGSPHRAAGLAVPSRSWPTRAAAARTLSTSSWWTSAPGTRSAKFPCWRWPQPASPA